MTRSSAIPSPDYADFFLRFGIDLVSISLFAFVIYLKRHARRDLFMAFTSFNIGLFVVLAVISTRFVPAAVGFGLFAMLSIVRLRSEPFSNLELGYFFTALVLALVNGMSNSDKLFVVILNGIVLLGIYVVDHPMLRTEVRSRRVTLDRVFTDPEALKAELEESFKVRILDVSITEVDYVRDVTDVRIRYVDEPKGQAATVVRKIAPLTVEND